MRRSQCLIALRSARGGGKGGETVLIAHGQRNPITVGIDYKIVRVSDFHAESGPSLEQKVKKELNEKN